MCVDIAVVVVVGSGRVEGVMSDNIKRKVYKMTLSLVLSHLIIFVIVQHQLRWLLQVCCQGMMSFSQPEFVILVRCSVRACAWCSAGT